MITTKKWLIRAGVISFFMSAGVEASNPEISAYYLSGPESPQGTQQYYGSLDNLEKLADRISTQKASFNNIVLSFVMPSFVSYTPDSLACTGLFGYTCTSTKKNDNPALIKSAETDFIRLKGVIDKLKNHGVTTYIAVGGWNYSCNPKYYDITTGKENACGSETGAVYDTFPNPISGGSRFDSAITGTAADTANSNVVKLAIALGAGGIDIDYEEFWHADMNAKSWTLTPDSIEPPVEQNQKNMAKNLQQPPKNRGVVKSSVGLTPEALEKLGLGDDVYLDDETLRPGQEDYPRAMPETVAKFAAIINSYDTAIKQSGADIKLSTAGPATGAIPYMSANWGTVAPNASVYGGAWWGGNLYGLIYSTALFHPEVMDKFTYVGIMTYDLDETDCGEESMIPCDLTGQSEFYYSQYITWLKSGNNVAKETQKVAGSRTYAQASIQPVPLLIKPPVIIGFEVGQPATGNLVLSKTNLAEIMDGIEKYNHSGAIMWDLYKDKRHDGSNWQSDWATPSDVLKAVCEKAGLEGEFYDCASNAINE